MRGSVTKETRAETRAADKANLLHLKTAREQVRELEKVMASITEKMDNEEGRSCCYNIPIVRIPERSEDPSMDLFLDDGLSTTALGDKISKWFTVSWCTESPGDYRPWCSPKDYNSQADELQRK
ncbi:hypothetical protein NDU88_004056 [Pleurodeles waltl]|uniref:Uncharacterized protein n=1 Tax=Pleurodeles waltl TaxID=8319 RepID=A0AAV7V088_PLEWA|nr:hypothetical protein NDU88_004056 [Pleurodeles waltl]